MYIHSVKLINFKSIGDYPEAEIILEPKVTPIIGKNESGKSNVLDGLSRISFLKRNPSAFTGEIINRNIGSGAENSYLVTLKFDKTELENGFCNDTEVIISPNQCIVKGGFFEYYLYNVAALYENIVIFLDEIGTNPFKVKDQDFTNYKKHRKEFLEKEQLDLYARISSLNYFQAQTSKVAIEYRETYHEMLNNACNEWFTLMTMFPVLYYRKADKHLNATYKVADIEKEFKTPDLASKSLLCEFVRLIDVSQEDFLVAVRSGTSPQKVSLRRKIIKRVDEKINEPFKEYYHTERITLSVGFDTNILSFDVQSEDGEALLLSERSNGLRWYLETFIDIQANDIRKRNVVYLLDEPGISLHVNAQKELLKMFNHLAQNGNQVVYTTHSPYMLDLENDGVHRIRAVVKNLEGYTYIYKTAYDARITPNSQHDTLAPIISAIGMNLNDTFGPAKDKINIVTEGMSDYIYLSMMAKVLKLDTEKYAILPSVGASNCINICSILRGWGCRFIAVFDYDAAGVKSGGEYMKKKFMFEYRKDYCYLADVTQEEVDQKS